MITCDCNCKNNKYYGGFNPEYYSSITAVAKAFAAHIKRIETERRNWMAQGFREESQPPYTQIYWGIHLNGKHVLSL